MSAKPHLSFNERCNAARPIFAEWCSVPRPADLFVRQRWTMCGVHLCILENLQNIYNLADTISPRDEQSFAKYVFFGIQQIEHHHHLEETIYYPGLEPEIQTDVLNEHASFSKALDAFDLYIKGVLGGKQGAKNGDLVLIPGAVKQKYDGQKIQALLEDLGDPLFTHLEHEIGWLEPEKIRSSGISRQRLVDLEARVDVNLKTQMGTSLLGNFLWHSPPYSYFPPAPWILKKIIVPWVFYWKDRREWRFLPKSFAAKP